MAGRRRVQYQAPLHHRQRVYSSRSRWQTVWSDSVTAKADGSHSFSHFPYFSIFYKPRRLLVKYDMRCQWPGAVIPAVVMEQRWAGPVGHDKCQTSSIVIHIINRNSKQSGIRKTVDIYILWDYISILKVPDAEKDFHGQVNLRKTGLNKGWLFLCRVSQSLYHTIMHCKSPKAVSPWNFYYGYLLTPHGICVPFDKCWTRQLLYLHEKL